MSALTAVVQIIAVNEHRTGTKDGRSWSMQDAECLLMNDDGTPGKVGVLMLPKELQQGNAPKPGTYTGQFTLATSLKDRRIGAQLVGLTPYEFKKPSAAATK